MTYVNKVTFASSADYLRRITEGNYITSVIAAIAHSFDSKVTLWSLLSFSDNKMIFLLPNTSF